MGFGSFPVRTPNGLGWGRTLNPSWLGLGSVSEPKMGLGVGPSLYGPNRAGG
ncbi:hypothetical protein NC652_003517 [Populus alba x Populus x berolinensis]|nr:hypothetical protein NC652_003517 [Populus alba x Populus x berolinensis]